MTALNHSIMEFVAWTSGIFAGIGAIFGQLAIVDPSAGWAPIVIQGGFLGVVVVLLLKFFPDLVKANKESAASYLKALEDQRKAHDEMTEKQQRAYEATIERIVSSHEKQMEGWRVLLLERGYCPVRDGVGTETGKGKP